MKFSDISKEACAAVTVNVRCRSIQISIWWNVLAVSHGMPWLQCTSRLLALMFLGGVVLLVSASATLLHCVRMCSVCGFSCC